MVSAGLKSDCVPNTGVFMSLPEQKRRLSVAPAIFLKGTDLRLTTLAALLQKSLM